MKHEKLLKLLKKKIDYKTVKQEKDSINSEVNISTMTINFKFNANININNVDKYVQLGEHYVVSKGPESLLKKNKRKAKPKPKKKKKKKTTKVKSKIDILSIVEMDDKNTSKSKSKSKGKSKTKRKNKKDNDEKSKSSKSTSSTDSVDKEDESIKTIKSAQQLQIKKKKKDKFLNQLSIGILVPDKSQENPVSVKLFGNGTIHMAGCVTMKDALDALCRTMIVLNIKKKVKVEEINEKTGKKIIKKKTVTFWDNGFNVDTLEYRDEIGGVKKYFRIDMVNANFQMNFWIDRMKLKDVLTEKGYTNKYDSTCHSGVFVKYPIKNTNTLITVIVFEKGKINISGVKSLTYVRDAYMFINIFLLENYIRISKPSKNRIQELNELYIQTLDVN